MLVCGRFPIRHSSNHHLVSVGFEGREKMRSKKVTIKSNQALPAAELMLCWYLSTDMKKRKGVSLPCYLNHLLGKMFFKVLM